MENNKYLLSMMVAKRVKELKAGAKPLVESKQRKLLTIALEEIKAGKVYLKEEEGPLKAEQIFNEVEEPEKPVKDEEISDEVKEPEEPVKTEDISDKDEEISDEVKEPGKAEDISDKVEKPAEIEEIFKKDEKSGKSKG